MFASLDRDGPSCFKLGHGSEPSPKPSDVSRLLRLADRTARLASAEGSIEFAVPQVRGLRGWRSLVREALSGRTEEIERLEIEMYARGLSVRDIECASTNRSRQRRMTGTEVSERPKGTPMSTTCRSVQTDWCTATPTLRTMRLHADPHRQGADIAGKCSRRKGQ
jgi:hypothetical protein